MLTPWHAAHHTHFTAEYGSAPPFSYRVMRGQYLAALAAGGRGFAGYASDFFLPEPRLRIGLPQLWREVRVRLGPKTDKFKVTGYPVRFRAAISGGAIKETMSTMLVDFE
ncbi:MAG: hypothetical protein FJ276_03870 [Planctomycetes bacterium]|nr:hypothetical protein [Planctomycetota bacterium]